MTFLFFVCFVCSLWQLSTGRTIHCFLCKNVFISVIIRFLAEISQTESEGLVDVLCSFIKPGKTEETPRTNEPIGAGFGCRVPPHPSCRDKQEEVHMRDFIHVQMPFLRRMLVATRHLCKY